VDDRSGREVTPRIDPIRTGEREDEDDAQEAEGSASARIGLFAWREKRRREVEPTKVNAWTVLVRVGPLLILNQV
jgi:hypothetical protein